MEELVKYVSDIIEFLVGGILLISTALLFLALFSSDVMGSALDAVGSIPATFTTTMALAAVAFAYAAGVVAEGVSRLVVEWRLTQLTKRSPDFGRPAPDKVEALAEVMAAGHGTRPWGLRALERARHGRAAQRASVAAGSAAPAVAAFAGGAGNLTEAPRGVADAGKEPAAESRAVDRRLRERARRDMALEAREEWRLYVRTHSEQGANEITAQLKRLRIERTFLLTSTLSALALALAGLWVPFAVLVALAIASAVLVNERFDRYLGTIVRAYHQCETRPEALSDVQ